MRWKMVNMKFSIKICVLIFIMGIVPRVNGQINNINQEQNTPPAQSGQRDSVINSAEMGMPSPSRQQSALDTIDRNNFQRYKIDGVAAVVGDHLVLNSDIKKVRADLQQKKSKTQNITDCQLIGHLMGNKLFSHAAMQDSTVYQMIPDQRIKQMVDQQLQQLVQRIGSKAKVLDFYRKESEQELRDELFKVDKENQLAEAMQNKITEEVEITPEEVRQFFDSIPKGERPKFSDEVEIAQIIIEPEVPQSQIDEVVDKLNKIRDNVLENGSSFNTKAVLYSEDQGSSSKGGRMEITREDPLDKDFKQIAFSLREGEISKPFKSAFGYHIIKVDKVLGQKRKVRHILLIPKPTKTSLEEAHEKADSIRTMIQNDKITFKNAAKAYSDDDNTRGDGGQLINPETGDTRFELTKIDPKMYNEVKRLKEGEVSKALTDQNRTGEKYYKLITVTGRYPEHTAEYSKDYTKIKNLALQKKQMNAIKEWREEEIEDTYIKVNGDYKGCDFESNWLKK